MMKVLRTWVRRAEEDIIIWTIWLKLFSSAPSFKQYRNKYFNYERRFSGVFSRDNFARIRDGTYVINLDDKQSKGTHWVSLFIDRKTAVYFDSFGIEYIAQEVLSKIKDKSIIHIFRIQSDVSIIYRFYGIAFIEYMISGKTLLDYIYLFSPNDY